MPDGDPYRRTGADTAAVVDTAALVEIIRLERAGVVATLRRLTGDLERAEDAFHDAVEVGHRRKQPHNSYRSIVRMFRAR